MFSFKQGNIRNRLIVSIPLFTIGFLLSQIEFTTIWKYLGLFNQILSAIMLWTASMYLVKNNKPHWLMSLPAIFMTAVCITYLLVAPTVNGGLALEKQTGYLIGLSITAVIEFIFLFRARKIGKLNVSIA